MHAELDGSDGAAVIDAAKLASGSQRDQGSEHVVIGRLIRRLRISDSPQHFQTVATTVLRTSLDMAAVAWVPKEPHDPVVISGAVAGLTTCAGWLLRRLGSASRGLASA